MHPYLRVPELISVIPRLNDTVRIRTVLSRCTAPYTVPYYCAQDYGVIQPIYGRKLAVFSSFTVRKRPVNDAVLIELGSLTSDIILSILFIHSFFSCSFIHFYFFYQTNTYHFFVFIYLVYI